MADKPKEKTEKAEKHQVSCGLVMPISALDGCSADHWSEVKTIICEAIEKIEEPKFTIKLVSDSDDVGVIQKRIVQNIYNSDIVVCDVSGKNPNVMFELGMRLAFDKATIIVKDDKTDYSFDTGIIEHVTYPRDLRFGKIVEFKSTLAAKVLATHNAASHDPNHSPFLKNFGKFQVATLNEAVLPADKLAFGMLEELQDEMRRMRRDLINNNERINVDAIPGRTGNGIAKITTFVARYQAKNSSKKLSELMGNSEFYDEIEKKISAPVYFSGRKEFCSAVDNVLKSMLEDE